MMVPGPRLLSGWSARFGRGGQHHRFGLPPIPAEDGPYRLRLYRGLSVDDPYQIAVCADVSPSARLAGYAAVFGDSTALVGVVSGMGITRAGALLAGLCHGLDQVGDHTSVRVFIDDLELVSLLAEALRPGGPRRCHARRLRAMAPHDHIGGDRICGHLRRLPGVVINPPDRARPDDVVCHDRLGGPACRLAWHVRRLAAFPHIGLESVLPWLATAAVLDDTVADMSRRLTRLVSGIDGAVR